MIFYFLKQRINSRLHIANTQLQLQKVISQIKRQTDHLPVMPSLALQLLPLFLVFNFQHPGSASDPFHVSPRLERNLKPENFHATWPLAHNINLADVIMDFAQ